jgi:competence protein ComEA
MKATRSGKQKHRSLAAIAIAIFSLAALVGCGGTPPIEISLSEPPIQQASLVYIDGAVNNPGLYPLTGQDSIATLIHEEPQKIDLNRAGSWLLEALPGIGEVRAGDIISYREQNGLFRNINELLKVTGIGPATFEQVESQNL